MKKSILYLFLLHCCIVGIIASPANPYPIEFTQPDGSKIIILLKGDEYLNWAETMDGYTILANTKGFYEYASLNNDGDLVCSGFIVTNPKERSPEVIEFLQKTRKSLKFNETQQRNLKRSLLKSEPIQKAFPTKGSRKLICILMDFSDKPFTKQQSDFNDLFNQVNYATDNATGSVRDFYLQNSYNQLDLSVTVVGPFRANNTMAYYGGPNGDARPLVTEAIQKADAYVNFAEFDNDNNGYVDGVYIIFGGYGEEAGAPAEAIWSHAWSISPVTLDGKIISSYSCSPELRGNSGTGITRIGVICHEFGHVLGAPDYYDTNYATDGGFAGTGNWDLMSGGNWNNTGTTPAHHNGYTKTHIYNWASSTVLNTPTVVTLQPSHSIAATFCEFTTSTLNEIYFCENRQNVGFDTNLPGHGMLVYHVHKDFNTGSINVTHPQKMYPVCANATSNPGFDPSTYGSINSGSCPFPGSTSKKVFSDITIPSSKSWNGDNTGKPLSNIFENTVNKTVSFDFMGGTSGNPTAFTSTALSNSSVRLKWNPHTDYPEVLIAYSATGIFATPVDSSVYIPGNTFPGGGTVIYKGTVDSFIHTGLIANIRYYYKAWSIKAGNVYSTGIPTQVKTLCNNASLPFVENFNATSLPGCWTINKNSPYVEWKTSTSSNAGGAQSELLCEAATNNNVSRIITAPLNTVGIYQLTLSFRQMLVNGIGALLKVQSSTDGFNWVDESWSRTFQTYDTIGPETVVTSINNNLNSGSTLLSFVFTSGNNASTSFRQLWYIDNVNITVPSNCTPPTIQVSNVTDSLNTGSSVKLHYTRGNGTGGVLILAREGNDSINTIPILGTAYAANSIYRSGNEIEEGVFVVYNGIDSSALISGLEPGKNYSFAFFEYNSVGHCYNIPSVKYRVTMVNRTWTGVVSNEWSESGNWIKNMIPEVNATAVIPGGCINYPLVKDQVTCKGIIIENGAGLTITDGANISVTNNINVGQGSGGSFIMDGGSCNIGGYYYTEAGSTTAISGGSLTMHGWGRYHNAGSLVPARGIVNLTGGTITSLDTVSFPLSGLTGTMSGNFVLNIYNYLNINSSAFANVTGGTINLLGPRCVFGSNSAFGKAVAYNLNVNVGDGKICSLCPPWSTKGALVKGDLNIQSGTADLTNGTLALFILDVLGNINISQGATLNCDNSKDANINLAGNLSNAGTFNTGSNTITFNGTKQQISGPVTFNNFKKVVSLSDTLTFTPGESNLVTITGTMNLSGSTSQLLTLRSAIPGLQWQIDPQGLRTIAYLDVQDSYNVNATTINAIGSNSITKGNNTNWDFGLSAISVNNEGSSKFRLFPNPVENYLKVICPFATQNVISVLNMDGKILLKYVLPAGENMIDVSSLHTGTYIVKIIGAREMLIEQLIKL